MTARITGQFEDFEGKPLQGVLELVPRVTHATVPGSRAVHLPATEVVPLDGQGRVDLTVVAPAPGSNPTDWVWEARPRFTSEGRGVSWRPFLFHVVDGGTTDLAEHAPVQTTTGTWITRGEPGDPGADGRGIVSVATTDGRLTVTYTDGTTTDVGALPNGGSGEPESGYVVYGDPDGDQFYVQYGHPTTPPPAGAEKADRVDTALDAVAFVAQGAILLATSTQGMLSAYSPLIANASPMLSGRPVADSAIAVMGRDGDGEQAEVPGPTLTVDTADGTPTLVITFPNEAPVRRMTDTGWGNVNYPQAGKTYRIPMTETPQ